MRTEYFALNGGRIGIPVAESYRDCMELVRSDRFRVTGKRESFLSLLLGVCRPYRNTFLFWFRLSSYRGFLYPFCRLMHVRAGRKAQIDIPPGTRIGYGLYVGHGICMVVNRGTVIGNNVNLSHFLNIGTNRGTPAVIGDNVYIGPHVSVVEDVEIGSNSTVGAGAVVTRDVPENATVAGVPAKVLDYSRPGEFILRRYGEQKIRG